MAFSGCPNSPYAAEAFVKSAQRGCPRALGLASTPQAAEFLGARARSILGPDIDLRIVHIRAEK
jgi:hypothetical protein